MDIDSGTKLANRSVSTWVRPLRVEIIGLVGGWTDGMAGFPLALWHGMENTWSMTSVCVCRSRFRATKIILCRISDKYFCFQIFLEEALGGGGGLTMRGRQASGRPTRRRQWRRRHNGLATRQLRGTRQPTTTIRKTRRSNIENDKDIFVFRMSALFLSNLSPRTLPKRQKASPNGERQRQRRRRCQMERQELTWCTSGVEKWEGVNGIPKKRSSLWRTSIAFFIMYARMYIHIAPDAGILAMELCW